MKLEFLLKQKLPDKPGVYFFKKGEEILYIGKATSLRSRTRSYFSKDLIATRGPVTVDMVFKADNIKWQETDTVLEAVILEANLIKKYQPYHNLQEKDDKSFNYVVVSREKLPRVLVVRGKNLADYKGTAFGPYTNGGQLREAMKIIRRIFPYLDEKNKNYLEFYRQINLAPDVNDRKLYLQNIKNIKLFLSGKKKKILQNLRKEMCNYAKQREFERAGEIKRQIFALEHINDIALLKQENSSGSSLLGIPSGSHTDKNFLASSFRIEAYDIAHMSGKNIVGVMTVVEDGQAAKNEYRKFKIRTQTNTNDTGALAEVLQRRLGHAEWRSPNLVVVDGGVAQINAAQKIVQGIPIVSVVKDERHKAKAIMGDEVIVQKHKRAILLANSEAHRFAIAFHKLRRGKDFLK
jgi:excinuclease ABC subunit C